MSMAFTPTLFDNPVKLREFFSPHQALERVKQSPPSSKEGELYFGRWEVVWIVATSPFAALFALFSLSMSYLTYPLYFNTPTRFFALLAEHSISRWGQLTAQWELGERLLVPTINTYQLTSWDIYGQSPLLAEPLEKTVGPLLTMKGQYLRLVCKEALKGFFEKLEKEKSGLSWGAIKGREEITQRFIDTYRRDGQKKAISSLETYSSWRGYPEALQSLYGALQMGKYRAKALENVSFYTPQGVCRGAGLWFIYLFLEASRRGISTKECLIKVAKEFEGGISSQGALLHSLQVDSDLLGMKMDGCEAHKVSLYELDHDRWSARKKIDALLPGIYKVGVYHHSLVYYKVDEETGYLWDPARYRGLFELAPEKLLNFVLKKYHVKGNPDSTIYFEKYSLSM